METIKALALFDQGVAWLPALLVAAEYKKRKLLWILAKWKVPESGHYFFVY